MNSIQALNFKKLPSLEADGEELGKTRALSAESELYKEFSRMLDKIAFRLSQDSEIAELLPLEPLSPREVKLSTPETSQPEPEDQEEEVKQDQSIAVPERKELATTEEKGEVQEKEKLEQAESEKVEETLEEEASEEVAAAEDQIEQVSTEDQTGQKKVESVEDELVKVAEIASEASAELGKSEEKVDTVQQWSPLKSTEPAVKAANEAESSGDQKEKAPQLELPVQDAQEVKVDKALMKFLESNAEQLTKANQQPEDQSSELTITERLLQTIFESGEAVSTDAATKPVTTGTEGLVAALIMRQAIDTSILSKGGASEAATTTTSITSPESGSAALRDDTSAKAEARPTRRKARLTRSQARTLERVEQALKEAARARDGKTISVRLDPPSLGSVRVDVSLRNGALHARLFADSAQVNTLLRDKSLDLQRMLRGLGFDIERVSVSVSDDGFLQWNSSHESEQQFFDRGGEDLPSHDSHDSSSGGITSRPKVEKPVVDDHWVA